MSSMVLLTDESSNMIGGTKPDAKNTNEPMAVSGRGHVEESSLYSPSRPKKVKNIAREPSMVTNPYQGKESNSMAQPIGPGPYLSPNQPDRIPATTHAVRIHRRDQKEERRF